MKRALVTAVLIVALATLSVAGLAPAAAEAVPPPFAVQRTRLLAPLSYQHTNDYFGNSVDVDGDIMVVGSPGDNGGKGAAFAFRRVSGVWSDPVPIVPPGLSAGDGFGQSVSADVSASGQRIVVGAPFRDTGVGADAGAVYVYKWTGSMWALEAELTVPFSATDHFGSSVAIDNGYIAIGCPRDDAKAADAGAIHVYRWASGAWVHDGVLTDSGGLTGFNLGHSVDIDATDDLIIVGGAIQAWIDSPSNNYGAVSTFDRDTGAWVFRQTLWAPADRRAPGDWFGWDVAISDRRIVVGASNKSLPSALFAGEAYTYTMPMWTWEYEQTLTNPNPSEGDGFGQSVAAEKSTFLVGAWYEQGSTGAVYQGAVYPYTSHYGTTTAWPKLVASGTSGVHFGTSVALSNGTIVGGAQLSSSLDTNMCGAAYVFSSRGIITGTVRDADTGALMPGVEVAAYYPPQTDGPDLAAYVLTDKSGVYTLSVDTGTYWVGAMTPSGTHSPVHWKNAALFTSAETVTVAATGTTPNINLTMQRIGAVFRFYNSKNGTHFFTPSAAERDMIKATWPHIYTYEGIAYYARPANNTQPLYRFYNKNIGSHFFTASIDERNMVIAKWPNVYTYEGETYKVSPTSVPNSIPVYRFYNRVNGSHFFTASLDERNMVIAKWPNVYTYEGIAFYLGQ